MTDILSNTYNMPCPSTSLPIKKCITGFKLAQVKGSICEVCYGGRGRYVMFPAIEKALEYRLHVWETNPQMWQDEIVKGINRKRKPHEYFRWFDVGDIQGPRMADAIVEICKRTPNTLHWLPTKEYGFARYMFRQELPDNLIVRVSAPMVDGAPLGWALFTSTVHDKGLPMGHNCPAGKTTPAKCPDDCRACWDKTVPNITYPLH